MGTENRTVQMARQMHATAKLKQQAGFVNPSGISNPSANPGSGKV